MEKIKCFVFDFDGTLVNSNKVKLEAIYEVARSYGVSLASAQKIMNGPETYDRYQIFEKMFELEGKERFSSQAVQDYSELTLKNVANSAVIKGAKELITFLKEGPFYSYINSATPEGPLVNTVRRMKWEHYFDGVFGRPRSKVENLEKIMNAHQLNKNEMLMIGDGDNDRQAAIDFGCDFWGIIYDEESTLFQAGFSGEKDFTSLNKMVLSTN